MYHSFDFYVLRLTLLDFFEVKLLNSHMIVCFVDARI